MRPEIRRELLLTLDRHVVGMAVAEDLTDVADRLLIDGTYTNSLGELTYLRNRSLEVVGPVFELALQELNIPVPDAQTAAVRVVRECAQHIALEPKNALKHLVVVRELEYYSDLEVDASALAYLSWVFEGSEDMFDDKGRVIEDGDEWWRMATHYAKSEAQEWLAKHPEESPL